MKKISTIRKEERKLRKFIIKYIDMYNKDSNMRDVLLQAIAADNILIWIQNRSKWTPSRAYCKKQLNTILFKNCRRR